MIISCILVVASELFGALMPDSSYRETWLKNQKMIEEIDVDYKNKNKSDLAKQLWGNSLKTLNLRNNNEDFIIFEDHLVTKNIYEAHSGYLNGGWSSPSAEGFLHEIPPIMPTERHRLGCYIKNCGIEMHEYQFSWEDLSSTIFPADVPVSIKEMPFLIVPWTTANIRCETDKDDQGTTSLRLHIKRKQEREITIIFNLKKKDENGKRWILRWVPFDRYNK